MIILQNALLSLHSFQSGKDLAAYNAQKKQIETDHKDLSAELARIQAELKVEGADGPVEKIAEIQVIYYLLT